MAFTIKFEANLQLAVNISPLWSREIFTVNCFTTYGSILSIFTPNGYILLAVFTANGGLTSLRLSDDGGF